MSKIDYSYSISDDVVVVMDRASSGTSITNNISGIADEICSDAELSFEEFSKMHFIYGNNRGKYNGVRFNKDHSAQFFSLNASNEIKALEYLKRLKIIHAQKI